MKNFLFLGLIVFSVNSYSKNVALLLAGTGSVQGTHEFISETAASAVCLKDRGFEVTVLAGGKEQGQFADTYEEDNEHYKEDFAFLNSLARQGTIRKENLDEQILTAKFQQLLTELQSGDTLELQVSAHGGIICKPRAVCAAGSRNCGQVILNPGQTPADFPEHECKHSIKIGGVEVDSAIVTNFVQALDRKNVKVNYLNKSCYGGFEKTNVQNLSNTCSYFGAGDRNVGLGCVELESEAEMAITTTNVNSAVFSRACRGRDQLLNDPYFQSKKCIQRQMHFLREMPGTTSMASIFMEARQRDRNPAGPNLSCLQFDHLDQDVIASAIIGYSQKFSPVDLNECSITAETNLESMIGDITNILQTPLKNAVDAYTRAFANYTRAVEEQRSVIQPCIDMGRKKCNELKILQARTAEVSQAVVDAERNLFGELRRFRPELFAGCQESACARELPN